MKINLTTTLILFLGLMFIPSFAAADYNTAYQKVIDDYNRAYNNGNGAGSGNGTSSSGTVNGGQAIGGTMVTPPLSLPPLFKNPEKNETNTESTSSSSRGEENVDNKLAYQSGSVKESLRQSGGTQFSASVVNSGQVVRTSSSAPYGMLLLIILMLMVLVALAWITSRKRRRLHQHHLNRSFHENTVPYPEY